MLFISNSILTTIPLPEKLTSASRKWGYENIHIQHNNYVLKHCNYQKRKKIANSKRKDPYLKMLLYSRYTQHERSLKMSVITTHHLMYPFRVIV